MYATSVGTDRSEKMTTRAVALRAAKEPLVMLERSLPAPGLGEVRLSIEACALGGADWNLAMLDALPHLPLVLGQEAVGRVEAVGPGVGALTVGQRVGLTPLATTCGGCELCERGLERYCARATFHGLQRDGALAEAAVVAAQHLVALPDGADAALLAPLLGSGWAALGALRTGGVGAGLAVGVFGVGGVGHLAVQYAAHLGARVMAVEPDEARAALAVELGATLAEAPDALDVAVVCTPSTQAIGQAFQSVKRFGCVVLAGSSPAGRFDLSLHAAVARGITVRGSTLGSAADLREVLSLQAAGVGVPRVERHRLEEAPALLYALRDGGFVGRLVFTP